MTVADHCWNRIGIDGDRSCPELEDAVHCRNCAVFHAAARDFFDRPAPPGYLEQWTGLLSEPASSIHPDELSLLIFRLRGEWFAFATRVVVEITRVRPVHSIPHRSNSVLVGLLNIRGRLQLQVSLHGLLGITPPGGTLEDSPEDQRLVIVRRDGVTWVFLADEVRGVDRIAREQLSPVPATLANPALSFSEAVVVLPSQTIGLLDDRRVFEALREVGR